MMYFWVFFSGAPVISDVLFIDDRAAIAAGAAFLFATASYLWTPSKWLFQTAFISYIILTVMVCLLVLSTGNHTSPFIALWMMMALFSGIFGKYGVAFIFSVLISFIVWQATRDSVDMNAIITASLATLAPLIIGIVGMRPNKAKQEEDMSYHELASELSSASGKAEVVIAAIAEGVLALDNKGVIELINPAAQKLIGWGKNDAIGLDYKSVLKIVDARDKELDPANDPVKQALESNKSVHVDTYSLLTADTNKKFLASITVSPVGSLGSGVIVVFRDITNEKAEEREQAEFISTASHEMRTPVASIEGYLGLALNPQTAQVDEKAREYIGKAQEAAKHLGRLFQDLLDVSRADDGRLSNNPKVVDVVPLVGDVVQGLLSKATEKGLTVEYKPDPDYTLPPGKGTERGERVLSQVLYVNVDNDHLREVVSNLVENAIKYTPSGSVTVDAEGDEQHVTISISDSGIGIPKEDLPHLFQKFYRVDNTETREIGGTGLGLYLCRKLTEAMGGQIWAESEYKKGSTFYVRFPRIDHIEAKQMIEREATVVEKSDQLPLPNEPEPQPIPTAPAPQPVMASQPSQPPVPAPQAPAPQANPQTPASPITNTGISRPPVDAMGPPRPRLNQAPLYVPNSRPNVPLNSIENNPREYIQSVQNQYDPLNKKQQS